MSAANVPPAANVQPAVNVQPPVNVQVPAQGAGNNGTNVSSFTPTKPKFGNLKQTGPTQWEPWTGGKPKADWTGLEDENPTMIQAKQF